MHFGALFQGFEARHLPLLASRKRNRGRKSRVGAGTVVVKGKPKPTRQGCEAEGSVCWPGAPREKPTARVRQARQGEAVSSQCSLEYAHVELRVVGDNWPT